MTHGVWPFIHFTARRQQVGQYTIIEGKLDASARDTAYAVQLIEPVDAPNGWGVWPTERQLSQPARLAPVASFHDFEQGVRWAQQRRNT